jgi:hypothetical protein
VTSFRQIEADRRNALRSTGPITEAGKHRSRRNAVRHGLCAETVVGTLEDIEDYKGFEAAIIADYDAETAVERELVLRSSGRRGFHQFHQRTHSLRSAANYRWLPI